jgi:hypothetical protein
MEAAFLQLAECQHMLEEHGKTPQFLGYVTFMRTSWQIK